MKRVVLLLGCLFCGYTSYAQTYKDWTEYIEDMRVESVDEEILETLYNELSYLVAHPLDINQVTEEELSLLPFLSEVQIKELINYRVRYGKMSSLYELKALRSLDFQTIQLMLPFVYVESKESISLKPTPRNLLKYGRNELFMRYDRNLNKKKGYRMFPDSLLKENPNGRYLGEPFYHSLRYSYTFKERLQAGFAMEKDAGEPFWKKGYPQYDYYSVHCFYKGSKLIQQLAIGDYKASFGQGLLMSMDFSPGRYALITQAERRSNGFKRHYSTNEVDFLRGVAASFRMKAFRLNLFYSYRKLDARLDSFQVLSFKRDGLHRMHREAEKKNQLGLHSGGLNFRFTSSNFRLGATAVYYDFGRYSVQPEERSYNRFAFRGRNNWGISFDYLIRKGKVKLYGETAMSMNRALATLNTLQFQPASYMNLVLLYRKYAKNYQAFYAHPFAQRSSFQGEEGVYLGMNIQPLAHWQVSAYADLFHYSWLNNLVDAPSSGKEYMVEVRHMPTNSCSIGLRYRFREKEINQREEAQVSIHSDKMHKLRLQGNYTIQSAYYLKTSLDVNIHPSLEGNTQYGWILSQNVGWKKKGVPVQLDSYAAYFQTDDFSTRVYSYEKNLLYAFSSSSFYGKGIRLAFNLRWYVLDKLTLSAKLAWVRYMDREKVGKGLEEIAGCSKTDLNVNMRWVF